MFSVITSIVIDTFYPIYSEAEAGEWKVSDDSGKLRELLSQNKKGLGHSSVGEHLASMAKILAGIFSIVLKINLPCGENLVCTCTS